MKVIHGTVFLFLVLLLFSCYSIPISFSESWILPETAERTIRLTGVTIDRQGGWDSLEKEVIALAPLYFLHSGYHLVESNDLADYAAHISLREREFTVGWRTRRSLAIEVTIWDCNNWSQELPLAAGRVVAIGEESFLSSKTTGAMLSRAIKETLNKLSPPGKEK